MTTVLLGILFNPIIGPLTPLIVFAFIGSYFVLRWDRAPGMVADCWPILLLPAFAIFSAFWSDIPATTVRYGVLYFVTVLTGVIMGSGLSRRSYLFGFFIAFAAFDILSLLNGKMVVMGAEGGQAFTGLADSKNGAGSMAAIGLIVGIAMVAWGAVNKRIVLAIAAAITIPVSLAILYLAMATGARISAAVGSACLVAFLLSRNLPRQGRIGVFVAVLLVVALLLATSPIWMPPLFELVMESSGKTDNLSGRGDLWNYADNGLIAKRPWLGLGFNAFWVHGNPNAEAIWAAMGIASRSGFNFHNTFREILVHLGYVGLVLYGIVAVFSALRLFVATIAKPRISSIFATAMAVYFAMQLNYEVMGFTTMHFGTISICSILAMGLRRDRAVAHGYGSSALRASRPSSRRGR